MSNGRGRLTGVSPNGIPWTYTGDIRDGMRHGRGKLDFGDGRKYEGDWAYDNKHGRGIFTWPNGEYYNGEWINNEMHGKGKYKYANGDLYEGELMRSECHGKGKMIYANGEIYEGDWVSNSWHGKGTWHIISDDNIRSKYVGDFVHNARHGKGKFYNVNNELLFDGDWLDDRPMKYVDAPEPENRQPTNKETGAKVNADLAKGLQVLRKRGYAGDVEAMKRLVMIFTRIMELATEARDFAAAKSAQDEGQLWMQQLKLIEEKKSVNKTLDDYRRMDRKISDAIQPCSTCAYLNTSHCNYFGQKKPSGVLITGCGYHT